MNRFGAEVHLLGFGIAARLRFEAAEDSVDATDLIAVAGLIGAGESDASAERGQGFRRVVPGVGVHSKLKPGIWRGGIGDGGALEEGRGLGVAAQLGEDGAEVEVAEIAGGVAALGFGELAEGVGVAGVLVELPEGVAEREVGGGEAGIEGDGAGQRGDGSRGVVGGMVGAGDHEVEAGAVAGAAEELLLDAGCCWAPSDTKTEMSLPFFPGDFARE